MGCLSDFLSLLHSWPLFYKMVPWRVYCCNGKAKNETYIFWRWNYVSLWNLAKALLSIKFVFAHFGNFYVFVSKNWSLSGPAGQRIEAEIKFTGTGWWEGARSSWVGQIVNKTNEIEIIKNHVKCQNKILLKNQISNEKLCFNNQYPVDCSIVQTVIHNSK